jgi:hypothetical protein
MFLLALVAILGAILTSEPRRGQAADPCAIPNFNTAAIPLNSSAPRSIVTDDFNKDGKLDLAIANNRSLGTVSILLGNGAGGFSGPTNFTVGRNPTFIAAGDLNGDTNPDLVVSHESISSSQHELAVLLGNGTGGFGPQIQVSLVNGFQNRTNSVAIGDVNGDGKPDLATASSTFNAVIVFFGDGTGHFNSSKSFDSGGIFPTYILLRDLNGDSKSDLIVANNSSPSGGGNIATFLGDNAGNFSAAKAFAVGSGPISMAVRDFNGDNQPDVAVINSTSGNMSVLLGDGAGNFSAAVNYSVGSTLSAVVAGDFNADGRLDLATLTPGGTVVIFRGDGAGSFSPVAHFPATGPTNSLDGSALTLGDFNGDGRPDLAALNQFQAGLGILLNSCGSSVGSQLRLLASSFAGSEGISFGDNGSASFTVIRVGDITGSAGVDYATSDGTAIAGQDYTAIAGTLSFAPGDIFKSATATLLNDQITETDETFTVTLSNVTGASLGSPGTAPIIIVDDDPPPTISISNATVSEGNSGNANAVFSVTLSHPSAFPITVNYTSADDAATAGSDYQATSGTLTFNPGETSKTIPVVVNGDTAGEVNETFTITLSSPSNASILVGQGLGTIVDDDFGCPAPTFGAPLDLMAETNPADVAIGDFNADGKKDLAVANRGSRSVSILRGNGNGGFTAPTQFTVGNAPVRIIAADFNLDGKLDLITANSNFSSDEYSISVLLGNGAGSFTVNTTSPVIGLTNLVVADLNADGKLDVAILGSASASKVSVLFGNGAGGFGAPSASYSVGTSPQFLIAADLNGDSKPDLITSNLNSNDLSVLLNQGDGTFAAAVSVPAGANPQSVAAGDLNGDGKVDLVVPLSFGGATVLLGNGAGGFALANALSFGERPFRAHLADLNGDGRLDLAVDDVATGTFPGIGSIYVFFGNGAGRFTAPAKYSVGNNPLAVMSGDFNSDGRLDLVAAVSNSAKVSVLLNTCGGAVAGFSSDNYTVAEGPGSSVNVVVNRSGDTSLAATVDYATSDQAGGIKCNVSSGSASSRCDYLGTQGTLRFAANEVSRTISIPIVDDSYAETTEAFTVTLSNPTGVGLAIPAMATITINDNETFSGPNPVDAAEFFVRQHYLDFLNREADQSGLNFWVNQITSCGSDQSCIDAKRINVSAAFFLSIEFQDTGYLVERIYKAAYGSASGGSTFGGAHQLPVPIIRLNEFLPDTQEIGQGVVVGQGNWQQQIESNKQAFTAEFVQRTRFTTAFPNTMTAAQFVDTLNTNAGNPLSSAERDQLVSDLSTNAKTRAQVLRAVAEDPDLNSAESNRAFVLMQFFGYLRRNPNDAPDSDYTGYDFWLTKLNQFNGNFVNADMVKAFISSSEYRQRFGP